MSAKTSDAQFRPFAALGIRTTTARFVAATALGAVLGAILLAGVFDLASPDDTATAYVRLNQPPDLVAIAAGAGQTTPNTQDNADRYVAGEVSYLSGPGVNQAVSAKLGKSDGVSFKVTQQGRSSVVAISSRSDHAADAVRTVQAVLDYYTQQLAQRADQQLRIILPALATWEQNAGDPIGAQQIRALRDRIQLQAANSSVLTVLQQPALAESKWHRWQIGAAVGALLGGAVSMLLMMRIHRKVQVVTNDSLTGVIDEVLDPVVDLRQPPRDAWAGEQAGLARMLYAQLPSGAPAPVILVLGASGSSGTGLVAALLRFAAAEIGPVSFIRLTDVARAALPTLELGTITIIDAGATGQSPMLPAATAIATDVVIVAMLEVNTVTQVAAALAATRPSDAPHVAILTDGQGRRPRGDQR